METIERAPRADKVAVVADVQSRLTDSGAAILTEYRGVSVANLEKLRRSLRASGSEYKIYKNTLVRRAATAAGIEGLDSLLVGPTGIAFISGDVSTVAKVLRDFATENPALIVKGGLIGKNLIDASSTAALADLPSRDVLLARIAGMLAAPMQQFASLLNAVPAKFAYALSALIESRPAETPATDAPAESAEPSVSESVAEIEVPAEEIPAEETPAEQASVDETPAVELSVTDETPATAESVVEPTEDEAEQTVDAQESTTE